MNQFNDLISKQFDNIKTHTLYVTDVDKDELWETYLDSFPEGTNLMFRERREYDCQHCKQFIRSFGNVVTLVGGELVSIWDIHIGDHFQVVVNKLSSLVKSRPIKDAYLHYEKRVGTDFNIQTLESGETIKWEHLSCDLPSGVVKIKDSIPTSLSEFRTNKEVLKRSLEEISLDSAETVLELIEQNSIYRGEEHKSTVELFITHKKQFSVVNNKDNYCWSASHSLGSVSKIRNTVIGTLLTDISEGTPLDQAVKMFESKVAPTNYKRPTALITKGMIDKAQKKVAELGIENSLSRRYAVTGDITINNVLFADRSVKKIMNVFDELSSEVSAPVKNLDKVEEVSIETFINYIVPKAETIELMVENKHNNNFMSLIAPVDNTSKNILKWDNNFSWSYNGEVTDSMKDRVKKAGGNVSGVLRFSIQWNDGDNNPNDFDAHCIEPSGNLIYYNSMINRKTGGNLDVDVVNPNDQVAVENITWPEVLKMEEGEYKFLVHNYSHNGGMTGFTAEIEHDGQIYSYVYNKGLRQNEKVVVAEIEFNRETGIKFIKSLPSSTTSKEIWNINTYNFSKVSMIMNSPNHWDGNKTGNKHYFFMLGGCKNIEKSRGFFNEFLNEDLREHRKVFEVLGSKMKTPLSDEQLSGVGFSTTARNSILCKVSGSFSRIIKIKF